MSYTALYRKWRPASFESVRGQDAVVKTLKNQIRTGRIGHAYLFCGTRGTGKTTIAKIFAKAVNCENPQDGNPCNQCPACQSIQAGSSINVVEIDAASNNGVDNIREIREEVRYSPAQGSYRVYIIDEVHMLSTGAFNALLKTLEEPPEYVIFILATTEAHKIPVTVLSRCQRYDFRRISVDTIANRLQELADGEKIRAEEKALRYIAKKADGSMRDGISLFDQCVAFYYGEPLTYDKVLEVLGAVDNEILVQLLRGLLKSQTGKCIVLLDQLITQGREIGQLVIDFTWYLRNLLLFKVSDIDIDALDISEENFASLAELSEAIDENTVMRYIRIFSDLSNQLRYATDKRILLELAFVKLTRPEMENDLASVIQRLSNLENQLQNGFTEIHRNNTSQHQPIDEEEDPITRTISPAQMEDLNLIQSQWNPIVSAIGGALRAAMKDTFVEPAQEEGCMCIVFPDNNSYIVGSRPMELQKIQDYIAQHYQKTIAFQARVKKGGSDGRNRYISDEELSQAFNIDLTEEYDENK